MNLRNENIAAHGKFFRDISERFCKFRSFKRLHNVKLVANGSFFIFLRSIEHEIMLD